MLPAGITAKAMQLCAAGLGAVGQTAPVRYDIAVHAGAVLAHQPVNRAEAEATVRDLITLGAAFEAGPLDIRGEDFASYGVTPASVFDPCALAHVEDPAQPIPAIGATNVSSMTALLRRAFGARITDTIRPMTATYGARYSWHKFGQAIDFVPERGVGSIDRAQIRAVMAANGVRLIELLGPGDRGHANHWHVAFAHPVQIIDRLRPVEGDEDWIVDVAATEAPMPASRPVEAAVSGPAATCVAEKAPPAWDVFAAAQWRTDHGGGS